MSLQEPESYYQRWMALDGLMASLIENYTAMEFPRKNTCLHLLESLRRFAQGQFQFFYFGFGLKYDKDIKDDSDPTLFKSTDFPPEDVLMGILEQVGHDLELIQRAADQRIAGGELVRKTLAQADKLAWLAVKPAINYAVVQEATTVLTYFQKSAEFYRIPYAQVAIIGIPYTCTAQKDFRDYLAIPHEVGHYVYRHSVGNAREQLNDLLKDLKNRQGVAQEICEWVQDIFEETFADIYGCLIAGPVLALDFQRLALAESKSTFSKGDGKHPMGAIRPYIYCQVLSSQEVQELVNGDWKGIAQLLTDAWKNELDDRKLLKIGIETTRHNTGGSKTIESIQQDIDTLTNPALWAQTSAYPGALGQLVPQITTKILDRISSYVNQYQPNQSKRILVGWAGEITSSTNIESLFVAFEENFKSLLAGIVVMPPEADPSSVRDAPIHPNIHTTTLWQDWVRAQNPNYQAQLQAKSIASGEVQDTENMKPGTWGYILFADGWMTTGPGNDSMHPLT